MAEEVDPGAAFRIAKACDRCRVRKIRCDRKTPCSSCTTAGIVCTNTTAAKQRPQQGSRVIVSKEYEGKIDAIEDRLDSIEQMLATSNKLLEKLFSAGISPHSLSSAITTPSNVHGSRRDEAIIGDTSLIAHSRHAREALEERLRSSPGISSDPDVIGALQKLQAAMQRHEEPVQVPKTGQLLPLPPYELFVSVVQDARAQDAFFFAVWQPFFSAETFLDMVTQLYCSSTACPVARQILVYGTMMYLFVENVLKGGDPRHQEHIKTLSHNFDIALEQHQTCTVATYETILAAMFAAAHSVQAQDYNRAWVFNTLASRMCQDLGWHRARQSEHTSLPACTLFWAMYYIDKCLSLRLGRSSTIQDYDITTGLPDYPPDPRYQEWNVWLRVMVEIGRIHGLIYERLYSPGSFDQPAETRSQAVQDISAMLERVPKAKKVPHEDTYQRPYLAHLARSNDVVMGCLSTLVHRAAPSASDDQLSGINAHCLDAARATIKSHLVVVRSANQIHDTTHEYATWTLLNCPFTPFIVLFSNIIVTLDQQDLQLLMQFVDSLAYLDTRSGDSMVQFRELCQAFYTLADHFVRASQKVSNPDGGELAPFDFDTQMPILPSALFDSWLSGCQDFLWDGMV